MSQANTPVQKPNSNPKAIITFGISVLVIVFGLFFGWMALAPLATSVVAVGQVSADTNKKTIQHLDGGIIKQILVKDGDLVKKGDTLIVLDDTQIKATLSTLKNQYYEALATTARLEAQEKKKTTITYPKQITQIKDDLKIKQIISGQQNILNSKLKSLYEQEVITKKRVAQFINQMEGLDSVINSNKQRLVYIQSDINEQEELYKEKLVDIQRLRELKREKSRLTGETQSASSDILRLQAQIDEAKSQQRLLNKEFYNEIANLIVENRIKTVDLYSKIESAQDKLSKINIKAPTTGYITGLQIHTIGGVITPSTPILDIVPKDSELFIVAQVNTPDIDKLKLELLADTRFSAFNVQQTYVVESKVINISADTFLNEQTGASYYEVKLLLTKKGKEQLKENSFFLLPGMPAEVMIKTGTRTALSYLIKPFMDMLSRSFNEE